MGPEWREGETRRNVQRERHKDRNKGRSEILWWGDFTGGVLAFGDGTRIEQQIQMAQDKRTNTSLEQTARKHHT